MKILALETSAERASVALLVDGQVTQRVINAVNQHSRVVLAMIDEILSEAESSVAALDAIAFGSGPGAFTGLRIACGVAQGLALGAELKVIAMPSLLAIAQAAQRDRVIAAIDARMGEIYIAAYMRTERGWQCELEPTLCRPDAAPVLRGRWAAAGNAFAMEGGALLGRYVGQLDEIRAEIVAGARHVAQLAASTPRAEWLDPGMTAPLYVRNKVALTVAER